MKVGDVVVAQLTYTFPHDGSAVRMGQRYTISGIDEAEEDDFVYDRNGELVAVNGPDDPYPWIRGSVLLTFDEPETVGNALNGWCSGYFELVERNDERER